MDIEKKRMKGLAKANDIALTHHGECLSTDYTGAHDILTWKCEYGHVFQKSYSSVYNGSWCPLCAPWNRDSDFKKKRLCIIQTIAKQHGGKCLSDEYINAATPLKFICKRGHTFQAPWNQRIEKGIWCPECTALDKAESIANEYGGHCLSKHYENINSVLRWRCAQGHEWDTKYDNIIHGGWCPECSKSKSERLCRSIFEALYGYPFPNVRPSWMIGSKGVPLEIDGYCEELHIGFEYQGRQHYTALKSFDELSNIQKRDSDKLLIAKKHRVTIVIVKYFPRNYSIKEAIQCVKQAIKDAGLPVPDKRIRITWRDVVPKESESLSGFKLELLKTLAVHNGELIEGEPVLRTVPLVIRCAKGHIFQTNLVRLCRGRWCPYCSHQVPPSIQAIQADGKRHGFTLLSDSVQSWHDCLEWQCPEGYVVSRSIKWVNKFSGCESCKYIYKKECHKFEKQAKQKRKYTYGTIELMREIAAARGGKCLSEQYQGDKTKLLWQCAKKHPVWMATPNHVKAGKWCPYCAGKKKVQQ